MDDMSYKELADAIVEQAGIDYLKALRTLDLTKGDESACEKRRRARGRLAEVRNFFKSKWYIKLCDTDGRRMIHTLNRWYRDVRKSSDFLKRIKNLERKSPL